MDPSWAWALAVLPKAMSVLWAASFAPAWVAVESGVAEGAGQLWEQTARVPVAAARSVPDRVPPFACSVKPAGCLDKDLSGEDCWKQGRDL